MAAKKLAPTARMSGTVEARIKTTGTFLDAILRTYEEEAATTIALLERMQELVAERPDERREGTSASGPVRDERLATAARWVHALFKSWGHPAPRLATVDALEKLGWRLGPGTPHAKAERLRKLEARTR